MKILLIYPRFHWLEHNGMGEPLGILMLHASLKKLGYDVDFLDTTFTEDMAEHKERIQAADHIGLSISAALYNSATGVLKKCHEFNPNAFYFAGGMHPTSNPEEIFPLGVDCCFMGESDISLPAFIEVRAKSGDWKQCEGISYLGEDGKVVENPRAPFVIDLDSLPHPSRYLIDYPRYVQNGMMEIGMVSSRGCPARCIICKPTMDDVFGCATRFRGPKDIVSEVAEICDLLHTRHPYIYFKDDTITLQGKDWFRELADELKKAKIHLKWHCNTRVDTVDLEMLKLMKKTGVHCISFGVEAGSQRILDFYRKDITPEQSIQAFKWCHEAGIEATANVILGAPIETREEMESTYQLLRKINPDDISVYFCTALPGKDLYRVANALGLLHRKISYEEYDTALNRDNVNINMNLLHITTEDLKEVKAKIMRYKALSKLLSIRNIGEWIWESFTHPIRQLKKAGNIIKMLVGSMLGKDVQHSAVTIGRGDGGYR